MMIVTYFGDRAYMMCNTEVSIDTLTKRHVQFYRRVTYKSLTFIAEILFTTGVFSELRIVCCV